MIRKIKIIPRMAIRSLVNNDFYSESVRRSFPKNDGIRLISINGSGEKFLTDEEILGLKNRHNVRIVDSYRFDDIRFNQSGDVSNFILFNRNLAGEIRDRLGEENWVKAGYNESEELLVVHCHAGVSRSGAIGSAIAFYLGMDVVEFREMNPFVDSNRFVLEVMLSSFGCVLDEFDDWWRNGEKKIVENGC